MGKDELRLYAVLSRAPFPKSYLGKVFLAAFVGTHVPLLALIAHLVRNPRPESRSTLRILSVVVLATLTGTAATLWALYALSAPVLLVSKALRRYLDNGEISDLPTGYPDRAGRLMADAQYAVERLDAALRSLGELASTDHLTGALNRRAGEERLAQDVARAQRGGGTLTLVVLDPDQLKPLNDRYGHRAGDACLKHFAEVLGRGVREGDWIARWGGDEFVVGMWHSEDLGAKGPSVERLLERVAAKLRENPVVLPDDEEMLLTFSGGTCRWRSGDDAGELFSKADEALFRAKGLGRSAIVHAD